jgi:hypothetical protein
MTARTCCRPGLAALGCLALATALAACPGADPASAPLAAAHLDAADGAVAPPTAVTTPPPPDAMNAQDATNATNVTDAADAVAPAAAGDPGRPTDLFGPKCAGFFGFVELGLQGQDFPFECTAYTHSTDAGTHVYVEFTFLPPTVASAYASIVLATSPLHPGLYSTVRAGHIELLLVDGRRFRLDIPPSLDPWGALVPLTLSVETVSPTPTGRPSHTIRGRLDAELYEQQQPPGAPRPPLEMHLEIDAPAPPGPEPSLQLDCRPGLPGAVDFRADCTLIDGSPSMIVRCQQRGGLGGFTLRVLAPDNVTVGEPIAIGGPAAILGLDGQITTTIHKPVLVPESAAGRFIFDEFVPGKVLRGRFIDATVEMRPPMGTKCRFAQTPIQALPNR